VGANLHVRYVEMYPEEDPILTVTVATGLRPRQLQEIKGIVNEQMEMLKGEPFIFQLCSELEVWLEENNLPSNASLFDKKKFENQKQKLREEDQRILEEHVVGVDAHSIQDNDRSHKIDGDAVTDETFAEWSQRFMVDFRKLQEENAKDEHPEWKERPTGKQVFEQNAREKLGLASKEEEGANLMVFDDSVFVDTDLPEEYI